MEKIKQIADAADPDHKWLSYTRCPQGYRVLNLNRPDEAAVFSDTGKVLETSMDDIESRIPGDYLKKNRRFMEESKCRNIMNIRLSSYYLYFTSYCIIKMYACLMQVIGN